MPQEIINIQGVPINTLYPEYSPCCWPVEDATRLPASRGAGSGLRMVSLITSPGPASSWVLQHLGQLNWNLIIKQFEQTYLDLNNCNKIKLLNPEQSERTFIHYSVFRNFQKFFWCHSYTKSSKCWSELNENDPNMLAFSTADTYFAVIWQSFSHLGTTLIIWEHWDTSVFCSSFAEWIDNQMSNIKHYCIVKTLPL